MCQIKTIKEVGIDDASLRIKTKFEDLIKMSGIIFFVEGIRKFKIKKLFLEKEKPPMIDLQAGDMVRVRSKEEILRTLDSEYKLEGCYFMYEMWDYCGSQQKVLKKVNYFYDERNAKMYKAKNIVLLDGVNCSGKIGNIMPKCDRNCLFFWKTAWLEKI